MLSQKIPQMCVMAHIKATNSERATAKIAKTATTSTIPRTTVPQPPQVTPMPPMTTDAKQAARLPSRGGRGSRSSNNRPPPGAVNLERSYQICQAVIQNSPNRHQLKAQLRPPPSMLSLAPGSSPSSNASNVTIQKRNETVVTSAPNRVIYKVYHTSSAITNSISIDCHRLDDTPLHYYHRFWFVSSRQTSNGQTTTTRFTLPRKNFVQHQASPILMRQVLTSNKNMPNAMVAISTTNENAHKTQLIAQPGSSQILNSDANAGLAAINQSGQIILVHRAGVTTGENRSAPRASSAPPTHNQVLFRFPLLPFHALHFTNTHIT